MSLPFNRLMDSARLVADETMGTEHMLAAVIGTFIAADLHWLARPLVALTRWRRRNQPITRNTGEEQD
ncbi:MAG: hypothetical protein LC737_03465, partial [Chloroflexi bacterium]|nr:hypothetical protein [Chloroflexota bacterium]